MKKILSALLILITSTCFAITPIEYADETMSLQEFIALFNRTNQDVYRRLTVNENDVTINKIFQEITRVENKPIVKIGDIDVNNTNLYANGIKFQGKGTIETDNFTAGVDGWQIKGNGNAEFNDIIARGTIVASSGTIGGWEILISSLVSTNGNISLDAANNKITVGLGEDIVSIDADDAVFRLAIGSSSYVDAPFRVTKEGALTATGATINGSIVAESGSIAGWVINTSSITSPNSNISLDSANTKINVGTIELNGNETFIKDDNFVRDRSGMYLSPEYSQLNNVSILGELQSTVYKVNTVSGVGGKFIISPASNLAIESGSDRLTFNGDFLTFNGDFLTFNGTSLNVLSNVFSSNTVILIQTEIDGNVLSEYMLTTDTGTLVSISTNTVAQGFYYNYTVERDLDGSGRDRFPAGSGVLSTGRPGEGHIVLDAQSSNNPFIQVLIRNTTTYNDITDKVTIGNLAAATSSIFTSEELTGFGIHTTEGRFEGEIKASTISASNILATDIAASTMTAGSISGSHTTIDSSGITSFDTTGSTKIFQVKTSGSDVGDVIIGDENDDLFIKWDNSTSSLTIKGAVDIIYKSTQIRSINTPVVSFNPELHTAPIGLLPGALFINENSSTEYTFFAPIDFPNDATVTEFQVFQTFSAGASTVTLKRANGSITSGEEMAKVFLVGAGGNPADTTIQNATIDNNSYSYLIEVIIKNNGSVADMVVNNIKTTYGILRPLP